MIASTRPAAGGRCVKLFQWIPESTKYVISAAITPKKVARNAVSEE
jgi:hypothetical protein